jgi:hypothetical protein
MDTPGKDVESDSGYSAEAIIIFRSSKIIFVPETPVPVTRSGFGHHFPPALLTSVYHDGCIG